MDTREAVSHYDGIVRERYEAGAPPEVAAAEIDAERSGDHFTRGHIAHPKLAVMPDQLRQQLRIRVTGWPRIIALRLEPKFAFVHTSESCESAGAALAIALSVGDVLVGRLGSCRGHVEWQSLHWDTRVTPVEFIEKLIEAGWDAYIDPSYWEHVRTQESIKVLDTDYSQPALSSSSLQVGASEIGSGIVFSPLVSRSKLNLTGSAETPQ